MGGVFGVYAPGHRDRHQMPQEALTMETAYIGPLQSENASTGRESQVELRVEPADSTPGSCEVGVYRYADGEALRLIYLTPAEAAELRDSLDLFIREG